MEIFQLSIYKCWKYTLTIVTVFYIKFVSLFKHYFAKGIEVMIFSIIYLGFYVTLVISTKNDELIWNMSQRVNMSQLDTQSPDSPYNH